MIIGPWTHMNMDKLFIKPLKYAHLKDDFRFFKNILPFWWYESWLKGEEADFSKLPPLQVFVLNKNIWRGFKKWPPSSN